MKRFVLPGVLLAFATAGFAQDFVEPKTGVRLPLSSSDGFALLGAGVRTKTFVVKVKVYVAGLYAAPDALAKHKGKPPTPELFSDLVWGDFPKQVVLRFVRDVGKDKIRELPGLPSARWVEVPSLALLRPGPSLGRGLEELFGLLHPSAPPR